MSTNVPLTIDNLGIDASRQYAIAQSELDQNFISDSKLTSQRTAAAVTSPYIPADYEKQFEIGTSTRWAVFQLLSSFLPPSLFTYRLIPSLGTTDHIQDLLDKLASLKEEALKNPEDQKQYQSVHNLLHRVVDLSRIFDQINNRRNQYHKG